MKRKQQQNRQRSAKLAKRSPRAPTLKVKAHAAAVGSMTRERVRRPYRDDDPMDRDAIPENLCLRCGFPGPHQRSSDCISALRDALAEVSPH